MLRFSICLWPLLGGWLLGLSGPEVHAQDHIVIDSLQAELTAARSDSAKLYWLHRLTWYHIANHTQQAAGYNAQARTLAAQGGDSLSLARCAHYQGMIERFMGHYPEAIAHLETASRYYAAHGMEHRLTGPLFNLGVVYGLMGDYEKALGYFYQELAINEKLDMPGSIGNTLNSMASIYRKMGQFEEALALYERARGLLEATGSPKEVANVLSNTGGVYLEQGEYERARPYFLEALAIDRELSDGWGEAYNLHRLGVVMEGMGDLAQAGEYLAAALVLRRGLGQKLELAETLMAAGKVWYQQGEPGRGLRAMAEALDLATAIQALETQTEAHHMLAETYRAQGQLGAAYRHLARYTQLRDSVLNKEKLRLTSELAARYESARKDQQLAENRLEIASVRAEVARQRWMLQAGLAGLVGLLVIVGLLLWGFRERRRRHGHELARLAQAQELLALRSVMTGEERERSRIARDLHDGLSSLLAAIKIQFSGIQEQTPKLRTLAKYQEALAALDEANREVRRIAHNMMPELLAQYGLVEALAEFLNGLRDRLTISFSHFGMETSLDPSTELVLYRIVQELINNIVKHSQATEALVQLNCRPGHLLLTVEDNGTGFSPQLDQPSEGLGLANLRSRVQLLQGSLHLESAPGEGSSIYIDIPLSPDPTAS